MAKFCGKCGAPTNAQTGLCPYCDAAAVPAQPIAKKFCGKCGAAIERADGVCHCCASATAKDTSPMWQAWFGKVPAGRTVLSVLIAVLIAVFAVFGGTLTVVRSAIEEETVQAVLKDIDWSQALKSVAEEDQDALNLYFKEAYNTRLSRKDIASFMEERAVREFIAEVADETVESFAEGKKYRIWKSDVVELLEDSRPFFEERAGIWLTDSDIAQLTDFITADGYLTIRTDKIAKAYPLLQGIVYMATSEVIVGLWMVLLITMIAALFLNSPRQGLAICGILAVVFGAILIAVLVITALPVWSAIPMGELIGSAVTTVLSPYWAVAIAMTAVGAALTVLAHFLKKRFVTTA